MATPMPRQQEFAFPLLLLEGGGETDHDVIRRETDGSHPHTVTKSKGFGCPTFLDPSFAPKRPSADTKRIVSTMPVSGEVAATETEGHHGFPSDVELGKVVFPLPQQMSNKYMTDSEDVKPVMEEGKLIKLFIDHSQDFLTRNGHLGIVDTNKEVYAGGLKFTERKRFMKDRIFVLQDKDNKPIALTVEDGKADAVNACIIYSSKPLVDGTAAHLILKEEEIDFHPWLRAVNDHPNYVSIDHWDGSSFKPFLRAHPDKKDHAVGLLIKSASGHHTLGHLVKMKRGDKLGWDLVICPGVDPTMMICITAAMEDIYSGKHLLF